MDGTYNCPMCDKEYYLFQDPDCGCFDTPQPEEDRGASVIAELEAQVSRSELTGEIVKRLIALETQVAGQAQIITALTSTLAKVVMRIDADEERRAYIARERMFASRMEYARQEKAEREARK